MPPPARKRADREVMRRDAACDDVERPVIERERFGVCADKTDVRDGAFVRELLREFEHARRHVARHHLRDVRRERKRGMACTGSDIQDALAAG